jgi:membrane-associated phospholipid phosphatase
VLLIAAAWVAAVLLSMLIDRWAFHHWSVVDAAQRNVMESKDWYRLLRILGYLPTWIGVALVFVLVDSAPARGNRAARANPLSRGAFVLSSAALGGLLAEAVKILARRARPIDTGGAYAWVPWDRGVFSTSDLGFPSSHAAVAFAAALAIIRLHPRSGWVMFPAAALCGMTRVWAGQHFVSDVAGAGMTGWAAAELLSRVLRPRGAR